MNKAEKLLLEGAEENNLSKVALTLNLGVDINTKFKNKERALHIASHHDTLEVAEFLISNGADITTKDNFDNTPLSYMVEKNSSTLLKILTQIEINPVIKNDLLNASARCNALELAEFLIKSGVNVNAINKRNFTALTYAIGHGSYEVTKLLIESGAVLSPSIMLMTVQSHAKSPKIVELLIDSGADINAVDKDGNTTLHRAMCWSKPEIADVLIKKGADLEIKNKLGDTPLGYFHKQWTTRSNPLSIVKLLVKAGANLEVVDKMKRTLLIKAINSKFPDVAEFLIELGVDVNATSKNKDKESPLYSATVANNVRMVALLIEKGADVNAICGYFKQTALHVASEYSNRLEIAELLIQAGASVDIKDSYGKTALDYACSEEIKELLQEVTP